ncbi:aminoglycoside phosphotransferase family protein [Pseudomonadota bacterium]
MTEHFQNAVQPQDDRKEAAANWISAVMKLGPVNLQPVSGDASFRRYFRFTAGERSIILMDAPPDKENSAPFIDIAARLRQAGLRAPAVLEFDLQQGFGLLEDFGDTLYRELISEQSAGNLFPGLFDVLDGMARRVGTDGLPLYDELALATELDLFKTWYLDVHRKRPMQGAELAVWDNVCRRLIDSARTQPQVFVHKDFHSCNLLQTGNGPGIIDFQDGLRGPISYDFVSLVWDRYITWPREQIEAWMRQVHERLPVDCEFPEWVRYCDWMGLQRNLKIVGIFARLRHRDGKQGYVEMIPRFYQYLLDVLLRYSEFDDFRQLLEQKECAP